MTELSRKFRTLIPAALRPNVASGMENPDSHLLETKPGEPQVTPIIAVGSAADPTMAYFIESALKLGHIIPLWHPAHPLCVEWIVKAAQLQYHPSIFLRAFSGDTEENGRAVSVLLDTLAMYPGTVINRPGRTLTNFSKPLHVHRLAKTGSGGVLVPMTRVASALPTIRPSNHITKSVSSVRSTCISSESNDLADDCVWPGPTLWQEHLSGAQWRVHVVGDTVIPLRVVTRELDYRYDDEVRFVPDTLPKDIIQFCLRATRDEGLVFSGIDLIQDSSSSEFFVFEVNPQPGYSFFEKHLETNEQPITDAVIQLLSGRM